MMPMCPPLRPSCRAVLLALAAALVGARSASADAPGCTLRRIAAIPARISPDGALLIAGAIDGTPVELTVETGLGFSAVSRPFAERIGLPIESVQASYRGITRRRFAARLAASGSRLFYGFAGAPLTERTRVKELRLDAARSDDESFAVLPTGGDGGDGRPVGLFGADYLSHYEVEIDPTDGKLNLFDQEHCPGRLVYWSARYETQPIAIDPESRAITTEVLLDGHRLRALLATGSPGTILPLATLRRVFGREPQGPDFAPGPAISALDGTPVASVQTRFDELRIGGILVHRPRLMVADLRPSGDSGTGTRIPRPDPPDLVIGMSVLRRLRLVISYRETMLYYTGLQPTLN